MRDLTELLRTGPNTLGGRYMRGFFGTPEKTGPSASVAVPACKVVTAL
jgi:hypothetical protein